MYPPGYYQSANGPMVTHALGHMTYGWLHIAATNEPKSAKQVKEEA